MVTYRSQLIVFEGRRPVFVMALLGLAAQIALGFFIALPFWVTTVVLGYLFRDPRRNVPPRPLAIVSPVDGTVTGIDTLADPYTQSPVVQIQVSKGYFDVMGTRSPIEGKIIKQWFAGSGFAGSGFAGGEAAKVVVEVAPQPVTGKSSLTGNTTEQLPEYCEGDVRQMARPDSCRFAQWIQSDELDDLVMAVKSANRFWKPRCYAHSGDRIGQGQRCGIIPFHAVVQINVPAASRLEVKVGDRVRGGADTLATLVH